MMMMMILLEVFVTGAPRDETEEGQELVKM